jgi:hypothetical protein
MLYGISQYCINPFHILFSFYFKKREKNETFIGRKRKIVSEQIVFGM